MERAELHLLRHIIENQRAMGRMLVALAEQQEMDTMALQDDVQAAAAATGQAAIDAANRVIDTINADIATSNADKALIAQLQATDAEQDALIAALQAQIDAGSGITAEAAQAVIDSLSATKAVIDGIDATPVEPVPSIS
jgi:hypothetical protein